MRKLVPFCLVTLAMTVSACGDDEGAVGPVDSPDGSVNTTTKEDSGAGEVTSETTSSDEQTSTASASDAGDEPTLVVDAGNDSGAAPTTDVVGGDSGVTSEPTTDGGPVAEVDAGDAGPVELTACESACAKAEEVSDCTDFSTCQADLCDYLYNGHEDCTEEADDYLSCIGTDATAGEFTCNDDKPAYSGSCDPFIIAWAACAYP